MSDTTDTPTPKTAPLMHAAANESIEAMFRRGCGLERQLVEATYQVEKYAAEAISAIKENERLFSQLAEARQQRDRLAEAIKRMLPHIPDMEPTGAAKYAESNLAAWGLRQALATLERKEAK